MANSKGHKALDLTSAGRDAPGVRFIDLFAGIGGIRLGFERATAAVGLSTDCVFSSEWDRFSQVTYRENFGEEPAGDITQVEADSIPKHDVLLAGFPCQPFSIAGVSKKNALGRPHGFKCKEQGNLFFEIARILEDRGPPAFMLENVKHLRRHDGGRTYQVIMDTLTEELGYTVKDMVYDAREVVPQHRERIFIIGFLDPVLASRFRFPDLHGPQPTLGSIMDEDVEAKYTLTSHLWNYLKAYKAKHQSSGNGFGYGLFGPDDVARTLSARYYKDGSEILIRRRGRNPRRLTPRECARLMGFPDSFRIVVSDTQAYRQFGNSVVVPVVEHVATALLQTLAEANLAAPVAVAAT